MKNIVQLERCPAMSDPNEILYVRYRVDITNAHYYGEGQRGEAEVEIKVPRFVAEDINPGDIFKGQLLAALKEFDQEKEKALAEKEQADV